MSKWIVLYSTPHKIESKCLMAVLNATQFLVIGGSFKMQHSCWFCITKANHGTKFAYGRSKTPNPVKHLCKILFLLVMWMSSALPGITKVTLEILV